MADIGYMHFFGFYLYLAVNVGVVLARPPFSRYAAFYIVTVPLLYWSYAFAFRPPLVFMALHVGALLAVLVKERRFILILFTLWNLSLYINFDDNRPLYLEDFFYQGEMPFSVVNLLGEVSPLSLLFLMFIIAPIYLIKGVLFLVRQYRKRPV